MSWLAGDAAETTMPPGARLVALLARPGILKVPGAHHALAGLLAKGAGFEALYLSGASLSASLGLADLGVMTLEELCFFVRSIARATALPLIVDADTGFGGVLNVVRTVRELEQAGAAAIQIEDQILPKKCGHLSDKRLVSIEEMAAKVSAARHARRDLKIVARTDAAAVEGIEAALVRAKAYVAAGADIIFPEALAEADVFRRFAQEVPAPLLANMTEFGRTPYFTAAEFESFGLKIVIWPVSSLRIAAKAMSELYAGLAEAGSAQPFLDRMQSRAELYDTIDYFAVEELDRSIAKSALPTEPPTG